MFRINCETIKIIWIESKKYNLDYSKALKKIVTNVFTIFFHFKKDLRCLQKDIIMYNNMKKMNFFGHCKNHEFFIHCQVL